MHNNFYVLKKELFFEDLCIALGTFTEIQNFVKFDIVLSILAPKQYSLTGSEFNIKRNTEFVKRWILKIQIDGYRKERKPLAIKSDSLWFRVIQQLKLLQRNAGILLNDVEKNSIHDCYYFYYVYKFDTWFNQFIARQMSQKSQNELFLSYSQLNLQDKQGQKILKIPGKIRTIQRRQINTVDKQIQTLDQQAQYNQNLSTKKANQYMVNYEQRLKDILPIKYNHSQPFKRQNIINEGLNKSQKLKLKFKLDNIHGNFDLLAYYQLNQLYQNTIQSVEINESQTLSACFNFLQFINRHNLDDVSQLKFVSSKRQIIKISLQKQRLTIFIIYFTIAIDKYHLLKSLCLNLLEKSFENYLVILNLLTHGQHKLVQALLKSTNKQHLSTKSFQFLQASNKAILNLHIKIASNDPLFEQQYQSIIQTYSLFSIKTLIYSFCTFFSFYIHAVNAIQKIPFLAVAPAPFLIQIQPQRYTLIIDFIHVFLDQSIPLQQQLKKDELKLRPFTHYFLKQMQKNYHIVSFSDLMPVECNQILNKIDDKIVKDRLYKYHIAHRQKGRDMSKVGPNLNRIIFLDIESDDNNQNLMLLNPWKGEQQDAQLVQICPLLAMTSAKKLSTIQSLQKIRSAIVVNSSLGLKYLNCGLSLQ